MKRKRLIHCMTLFFCARTPWQLIPSHFVLLVLLLGKFYFYLFQLLGPCGYHTCILLVLPCCIYFTSTHDNLTSEPNQRLTLVELLRKYFPSFLSLLLE